MNGDAAQIAYRVNKGNDVREEVRERLRRDGYLLSPVELSLEKSEAVHLPPLRRNYFNVPPAKAKITNNGWTVVYSGKWEERRPFLCGGPFREKYVFFSLHFHWAESDSQGSEHVIDGHEFPLEMHVAYFKAAYRSYSEAAAYRDGIVFEVHLFYMGEERSGLRELTGRLGEVRESNSSAGVQPLALSDLFRPFVSDYLLYAGRVIAEVGSHQVLWLLSRTLLSVSHRQMIGFRTLSGKDGRPLFRNTHYLYELGPRQVYHVDPSGYRLATLLPRPSPTFHPTGQSSKLRLRFRKLIPSIPDQYIRARRNKTDRLSSSESLFSVVTNLPHLETDTSFQVEDFRRNEKKKSLSKDKETKAHKSEKIYRSKHKKLCSKARCNSSDVIHIIKQRTNCEHKKRTKNTIQKGGGDKMKEIGGRGDAKIGRSSASNLSGRFPSALVTAARGLVSKSLTAISSTLSKYKNLSF